jgi:hypothetical protein
VRNSPCDKSKQMSPVQAGFELMLQPSGCFRRGRSHMWLFWFFGQTGGFTIAQGRNQKDAEGPPATCLAVLSIRASLTLRRR